MTKLTHTIDKVTVGNLMKEYQDYDFDLCIQRNEVWDEAKKCKKSLFIHTLAYGYIVPPIMILMDTDGKKHVLDGKQRLTTIIRYISNEFKLAPDTAKVGDYELAGKRFGELDEAIQSRILSYSLLYEIIIGMTDEERDEQFTRLNAGGEPLTKIELLRATAHGHVMNFINKLATMPFFEKVNITELNRNRFVHHELIFQTLINVMGVNYSFSSTDISKFATYLKENGIPEAVQKDMFATAEYLNKAVPKKLDYMKKIHVTTIFKLANEYREKVDPDLFFEAVKSFFANKKAGDKYSTACTQSCATLGAIEIRYKMMKSYLENFFKKAQTEAQKKAKVVEMNKENAPVPQEPPQQLNLNNVPDATPQEEQAQDATPQESPQQDSNAHEIKAEDAQPQQDVPQDNKAEDNKPQGASQQENKPKSNSRKKNAPQPKPQDKPQAEGQNAGESGGTPAENTQDNGTDKAVVNA